MTQGWNLQGVQRIRFDALNSWWLNKIDFFQYLNANSLQIEELLITDLIQNGNCSIYFYVWKKIVFFIFQKSIFYNWEKSTVASIQKGIQRKWAYHLEAHLNRSQNMLKDLWNHSWKVSQMNYMSEKCCG